MPVVTTMHTLLWKPDNGQKRVIRELAHVSDRRIVMSRKGSEILQGVYGIPGHRISYIPHGIPDLTFVDPNFFKEQFGVEGRKVILTFGLLRKTKKHKPVALCEEAIEILRGQPEYEDGYLFHDNQGHHLDTDFRRNRLSREFPALMRELELRSASSR